MSATTRHVFNKGDPVPEWFMRRENLVSFEFAVSVVLIETQDWFVLHPINDDVEDHVIYGKGNGGDVVVTATKPTIIHRWPEGDPRNSVISRAALSKDSDHA